jgi:hypothetical protein
MTSPNPPNLPPRVWLAREFLIHCVPYLRGIILAIAVGLATVLYACAALRVSTGCSGETGYAPVERRASIAIDICENGMLFCHV